MPQSNHAIDAEWSLNAHAIIDNLCDLFEERLKNGEEPNIEEMLPECPDEHRSRLACELREIEKEYRRKHANTPASDATTTHSIVSVLPKIEGYEVLAELGEGGMGVVYKAKRLLSGQVVAVKMIRSGQLANSAVRQRFRIEADTIAALDHPHIVPLFEVGETDGEMFLCLKFLEGGSLANLLDKGAPCEPKRAATLVMQIARAIQHAHERGVLHRDLKPGNILLDSVGNAHVTDFGLARRLDQMDGVTKTGELLGTVQYMSPEQARAERHITIAADVYGLGAILYALLTGRPPFRGSSYLETLQQVQTQPPSRPSELNKGVPRDLESICLQCLQKEPAGRPASADALADDLKRFLHDKPPMPAQKAGVADVLRRLFTEQKETSTLVTLPVFWWLAGLVILANTILWLLGEANAEVWTVWLLQGAMIGVSMGVNWWYHVRNDQQLNTFERQSMAIHVAHQIAIIALFAIVGPHEPSDPARALFASWIPAMAITTGLAWFAHGPIGAGSYYLMGLFFFPVAVLLRFWPPYAPLVYGGCLSGSLLLAGWQTGKMLKRVRAREAQHDAAREA